MFYVSLNFLIMKTFLSLFSVLTFVLLSLVFTSSQASPDKHQNSEQSLYQSIQPLAVVAVTFEVFTPSVLNPCPVNLIDTYIETGLKPLLLGDSPNNLLITYFYLPNPYLFKNLSLAENHNKAYFAPCLRKTIAENHNKAYFAPCLRKTIA